ncbi:MAG: sigma-54-dependent transcriptional regulator [Planctomycetota bacterium]
MKALLVDDELAVLRSCARVLRESGFAVEEQSQSALAIEQISADQFDVVVCDIRMPDVSGVELLRAVRERDTELPFILMSGFPTLDSAIEAVQLGASAYLLKPVNPQSLIDTVRHAVELARLRRANRSLERQVRRDFAFGDLVAGSPAMQPVKSALTHLARSAIDVLIIGETGTGKELIARNIHKNSPRAAGPLIPVDCGAIPESLFEAELFGHERGAFTGATQRSLGLLELADGGTLFLDEILSLSATSQARMMRMLQERSFRRVGGREQIPVDVRIVSACNRDPAEEVRAGRLREDLYYRLNVGRIELPPLRKRPEDIPALVNEFVHQAAREASWTPLHVDADTLDVLRGYAWPGNVRELQNAIRRAVVMSDPGATQLDVSMLPEEVVGNARKPAPDTDAADGFFAMRDERITNFERDYLTGMLQKHQGDVPAIAAEAQVPRGTLYRLLRKHGLDARSFRPA